MGRRRRDEASPKRPLAAAWQARLGAGDHGDLADARGTGTTGGAVAGMSATHRLGSWTLPSGDSCDVDLVVVGDGIAELRFWWDSGPPFVPGDEAYYKLRVIPEVNQRIREYTERLGTTLWVMT